MIRSILSIVLSVVVGVFLVYFFSPLFYWFFSEIFYYQNFLHHYACFSIFHHHDHVSNPQETNSQLLWFVLHTKTRQEGKLKKQHHNQTHQHQKDDCWVFLQFRMPQNNIDFDTQFAQFQKNILYCFFLDYWTFQDITRKNVLRLTNCRKSPTGKLNKTFVAFLEVSITKRGKSNAQSLSSKCLYKNKAVRF